ncbi:MBOAT, membrane-bound O-acyltransferase family-domain-containing protein [Phascolomyces articulosus]|uniref:MBOAT, membrane-bound O-acyltransferase family-domain-containing protein n=1 Tax=Phascolomyces articulosus TaxID=60185 RepID=A0AAD5KCN9_9FUNG|nr:MBOAT, membrane-bound O-acyltransferase family-domain-containing protein [Phascolomyces articulosus]
MDAFFDSIASLLGDQVSGDHIKLVTCLIGTYPLALVYRKLPAENPTSRHVFSIAYVLFTMVYMLKFYTGAIHTGFTALFTYFFVKYYHGKSGPYINFVIALLSMSICHIDRQLKGYVGDTKLDYSGIMMVLIFKVSSFGFNVADGRYGAVTDFNKRMKIDRYPSLIEYFGWLCFFGGFYVGPTCEYMDYYRYTNYFFLSSDKHLSPYKPALKKVLLGVIFAGLMSTIGAKYTYFRMMEVDYLAMPFYKRFIAFELSGFVTRSKFYCVWMLAEGSCILSGFGYNGIREGKHRWDRLTNIDWYAIETAQSMRYLSNRWNRSSNTWIRHYVYFRLATPESKNTIFALVASYTTSSIFHGFYSGYYLFFVGFSIFQILDRRMRKILRPLVMSAEDSQKPLPGWKKLYDIAGYIISLRAGCALTAPFELLYLSRVVTVWGSVYYFHLVAYAVLWILLLILEPTFLRIQERRLDQAAFKKSTKTVIHQDHNDIDQIVQKLSVKYEMDKSK